ncbi:MAG TPA: PQQ-dependent dehydrogenase, methanol/ethanol family [Sneathiellales bacterium]|nr:PQQ-dependent dehydrogenase, methanol/ethanol family [Sneathiellales bacterium]
MRLSLLGVVRVAGLFGILATAISGAARAVDVTEARLLNAGSDAEAANWLTHHRTYDAHRYSPLNGITTDNVSGLKLAYAVPLGGWEPSELGAPALQATPLVDGGFLYVTDGWGSIYKIDGRSGDRGRVVWKADFDMDHEGLRLPVNRGVALWNNLVFSNLGDGRVVAVDDPTGEIAWEKQVASGAGEGFTGAPLIADNKLIVGQAMGDWATRGFIAALNPATGDEYWRFHTVPAPDETGGDTWRCAEAGNVDCWKVGGAGAWATGSYDPDNKLLIMGTGNPVPMFDPESRPGDNLYSNSTVALDIETGKLVWYFQYTPGDYMDFDETGVNLLIDREIKGEKRKVVAHFGRNGFFYRLDRTNGSFIGAKQYVDKLTWTEGVDPKTGIPLGYDPASSLQEYTKGQAPRRKGADRVTNCPHLQGGVNFWPTAYNPELKLAYGASIEACSEVVVRGEAQVGEGFQEFRGEGEFWLGAGANVVGTPTGSLSAIDVATGAAVVKVALKYPNYSGVMTTKGKLLFTGHLDGTFSAYDAKSLKELWHINLGVEFQAPPMTFAVDGKQYVAILGGGGGFSPGSAFYGLAELAVMERAYMLWVFAL